MHSATNLFLFTFLTIISTVSRAGQIVDASYDRQTRTINVAVSDGCNKYEYAVDYKRGCTKGRPAQAEVDIVAELVEKNDCAQDYQNVVPIYLAKFSCKPPMLVTIRESDGNSLVVEVTE